MGTMFPDGAGSLYRKRTMELHTLSAPRIPVNLIVEGRNPRTTADYDIEELKEFAESIRASGGVAQPILLRPWTDGKFQIVAGWRRWRGTIIAFGEGDDVTIPADIRVLTDDEADRLALVENTDRKPMTPLDEAEAAARILAACKGDRAEAARQLGWKQHHLDQRLALMYAAPDVRAALRRKQILLGHAELLAALRKESQQQALASLLNTHPLPEVAKFKAMLERMALSLTNAIFDKTQCGGCPHNSGTQQAMFAEAIKDGSCTNKLCYDGKVEAVIQSRAEELKSDFQVVRIVRAGDNFTLTHLRADGPKGVGEEQAVACRSCQNFGAAVSALADSAGKVYRDQCMDTPCNTRMVAARIRAEQDALKEKTPSLNGQSAEKAPADSKKPRGNSDKASPQVQPSKAVIEYRERVWRAVLSKVTLSSEAATNRCILLSLAFTSPRNLDSHAMVKKAQEIGIDLSGSSPGAVLDKALQLEHQTLSAAVGLIAAFTSATLPINEVVGLLKVLNVNLADHWKVNSEFFELLTKNEIDYVCTQVGIKEAMSGSYAKSSSGKKDEFIKAIMSLGNDFKYEGRIPSFMKW